MKLHFSKIEPGTWPQGPQRVLPSHPRLASIQHAGPGVAPASGPVRLNIQFVTPKPEPPTIDIVPQVVSPEAAKLEERLKQARAELARLKALENGF